MGIVTMNLRPLWNFQMMSENVWMWGLGETCMLEVGVGEVMGNQIGLDCSEKNMHKKKKRM